MSEEINLEDLDQLTLAGEPEREKEKDKEAELLAQVEALRKKAEPKPEPEPVPEAKPSPRVQSKTERILAAMKKRAESNALGEIFPSWDFKTAGKGAYVFGVLLEKRMVVMGVKDGKPDERRLFVIDNQIPTAASDMEGAYEAFKGPLTVWSSKLLDPRWEKSVEGEFTYIQFLGSEKSKSTKMDYNNFVFSQMSKDELGEVIGG